MKIALASDVHLEFGHLELNNDANSDVLVLSGDICTAKNFGPNYDRFFQDASRLFKNVVYVMGNHEHYNGDFAKSESIIRSALERYSNIHFLEKTCVKIDDVTFIGGTLWTNMNKRDAMTMLHVQRRMNDFQIVKNGDLWFTPEHAVDEFDETIQYIQTVIEGKFDEKFVVVGHHAPSRISTHPRYKYETLMNGAYSSELDEYILDHPQIKLWTHGHTHEDFDYMIGSTRIACNPRGYIGYEGRADNWTLKTFEV